MVNPKKQINQLFRRVLKMGAFICLGLFLFLGLIGQSNLTFASIDDPSFQAYRIYICEYNNDDSCELILGLNASSTPIAGTYLWAVNPPSPDFGPGNNIVISNPQSIIYFAINSCTLETGKQYYVKTENHYYPDNPQIHNGDPFVYTPNDSCAPPPPPPQTSTTTITITNPAGGENWYIGDTHDILWTSVGTTTDVLIYLCDANATSTCNLLLDLNATSTPNTGTYSWNINPLQPGLTPGYNYVIKIEDVDNASVFDLSEIFTISEKSLPPPPPPPPPPTFGGGNGPILSAPVLKIENEKVTALDEDKVIITWDTNKPASERVFYSTTSSPFANPNNFQIEYLFATPLQSSTSTNHSIIISGLQKNIKYYFRPYSDTVSEKAGGIELNFVISTTNELPEIPSNSCEYIKGFLRLNRPENNEDDTIKLQKYLKKWGYDVETTGVFDLKTDTAVQAYQLAHRDEILAPWGIDIPTGYVYLTTRKHINETECKKPYPLTSDQQEEINKYKAYVESLPSIPAPSNEVGVNNVRPNMPNTPNRNNENISKSNLNSIGIIKPPFIENEKLMAGAGNLSTENNRSTSTKIVKSQNTLGTITAPIIAAPKFIMNGVNRLLDLIGL